MYEVSFPVCFPCVDIAVIHQGTGLLLGRKDGESLWRFPGGFVDPGETFEEAAARELMEETNLNFIFKRNNYIGSFPIRDKRYTDTPHHITTAFYIQDVYSWKTVADYKAGDDLADVGWFEIGPHLLGLIELNHKPLLQEVLNNYG